MKKLLFQPIRGLLILCLGTLLASAALADQDGDRLLGVWEPSNGRARVKIEKIGVKYYGKIVWLKEPNDPETGLPKTDKNNPDATLQKVSLKGYRMLKDFVYQKNNEWSEGTIYDPLNGSTSVTTRPPSAASTSSSTAWAAARWASSCQ